MNGVALELAADTVDLEMQQRTRYVLFVQVTLTAASLRTWLLRRPFCVLRGPELNPRQGQQK